jgi:molybdenum cofactor cytidylyltransferase
MTQDLAIVQLAAGLSRRMGGQNKLMLRFGGETLVARTARVLLRLDSGSVTVVLGHEADRVAMALAGLPVQLVRNPAFAAGQMGSVRVGLAAAPAAAAVLLSLSDQPQLSLTECRALVAAHGRTAGDRITVPVRRGPDGDLQRGNPIVIPAALRLRLLSEDMALGCRGLTQRHPELVHAVEMAGDGCFADLDTADDVAAEQARRAGAIWGADRSDERTPGHPRHPGRA